MIGEGWKDGEMGFLARDLDVWLHKTVTRSQRGLEEEVLVCPWRGSLHGLLSWCKRWLRGFSQLASTSQP